MPAIPTLILKTKNGNSKNWRDREEAQGLGWKGQKLWKGKAALKRTGTHLKMFTNLPGRLGVRRSW